MSNPKVLYVVLLDTSPSQPLGVYLAYDEAVRAAASFNAALLEMLGQSLIEHIKIRYCRNTLNLAAEEKEPTFTTSQDFTVSIERLREVQDKMSAQQKEFKRKT